MTTQPRTLEELADWLYEATRRPGVKQRKPDGFNRDLCLAALREAADAARQEEREALQEEVESRTVRLVHQTYGDEQKGIKSLAVSVLGWLDARSRGEEPR